MWVKASGNSASVKANLYQKSRGKISMLAQNQPTSSSGSSPAGDSSNVQHLRLFVFALFFFFGGITSLNDIIIPKLKGLFTLSYGEVMLIQSAFFTAYLVISLPAAVIVRRLGCMRTAVIGLLLMTAGC